MKFLTKRQLAFVDRVANECSAYKQVLVEHKIKFQKLDSDRFASLPILDKESYIKKYALVDRLYKGDNLSDFYWICSSSGSTGEPTFWPRHLDTDFRIEKKHTDFLNQHFGIVTQSTLIVITFGLGSTTAGMFHSFLSWLGNKRGPVSVITPGVDFEQAAVLIEHLYENYDQVICIGYPPIIEQMIEFGVRHKFGLRRWKLKIVFASESAPLEWRENLIRTLHGKFSDIVTFLGCSEAGMLGFESPQVNQWLKQIMSADEKLWLKLFGVAYIPTLVEVNLSKKYIEIVDGEIVITVDQPIPLVRYNLHDYGKLLSGSEVNKICIETGIPSKLKNGTMLLAVNGRNNGNYFSVEEIKLLFAKTGLKPVDYQEFQYRARICKDTVMVVVQVYYSNSDQKNSWNRWKRDLPHVCMKIFKQKLAGRTVDLKLILKPDTEKMGIKSGKLRYFLVT